MMTRYVALGPLLSGEGSRAFIGLQIADDQVNPCALIWVPEHVTGDPTLVERLRRETLHAAGLTHPNIVRVIGLIDVEEGLARVVEFADGESLRRVLEVTKRLPVGLAARVVVDAAHGVQYAHLCGNADGTPLVHGDLRPETLLVTYAGVTKVTGYGALSVAPKEMGGKRVMGRRQHCAPEQILGGRYAVTPQTDVYLLGVILYEALTGEFPFQGEKDFEQAVLNKQPAQMESELIPPRLRPVLVTALAKKGNARYSSVQEFREAVEEAMGGLPETADLHGFLERAFAGDDTRQARRQELESGIQDWKTLERRKAELEQPAGGKAKVTTPSATSGGSAPLVLEAPLPPGGPAPFMAPPREAKEEAAVTPPPAAPAAATQPTVGAAAAPLPVESTPSSQATAPARSPAPIEEWEAPPAQKKKGGALWIVGLPAALAAAAGLFWLGRHYAPGSVGRTAPTEATSAAPAAPAAEPPAAPAKSSPQEAAPSREPPAHAAAEPKAGPQPSRVDLAPLSPPKQKGTLEVVATPSLNVSIDGKPVGRTPLETEVTAGTHRVTLVDSALGIRVNRTLHAKPGSNRLAVTVGKGSMVVHAPPGCEVRIDRKLVGTTPLGEPIPLYEGSHRIEVSLGEAKWQQPFTVSDGQQLSADVAFEKKGPASP